jgi:hypothetical protein
MFVSKSELHTPVTECLKDGQFTLINQQPGSDGRRCLMFTWDSLCARPCVHLRSKMMRWVPRAPLSNSFQKSPDSPLDKKVGSACASYRLDWRYPLVVWPVARKSVQPRKPYTLVKKSLELTQAGR